MEHLHINPPIININHRRNRDTEHVTPTSSSSCKRIRFDDDVIFRPVVKDELSSDLKVECVSDDVISEICLKTESTESLTSSNSKKNKNNSPSNEATSRRHLIVPSAKEIDEFFKEAEKHEQKRFIQKYNFDIVKDVPIEGRYEWVKLKPIE